jgi:hypothetical protein
VGFENFEVAPKFKSMNVYYPDGGKFRYDEHKYSIIGVYQEEVLLELFFEYGEWKLIH